MLKFLQFGGERGNGREMGKDVKERNGGSFCPEKCKSLILDNRDIKFDGK